MDAKDKKTEKKGYNNKANQPEEGKKRYFSLMGLTPAFTADRALTYIVGTAVFFAGGYVIYYFVKKGFEGLENKGEDSKKETDSGKVGNPILVYSETIQSPTLFPIQATNLNFPTYDRNVQIVQEMMMRVFGNVLPSHGADGKFGLETKGAVQNYVNSTGIVTKADWETLVKRASQMTAMAKQATEQVKIAVMPSSSATTQEGQKDMRDVYNRPQPPASQPPASDVIKTGEVTTPSKNNTYPYQTLEYSLEGLDVGGKYVIDIVL